jgi:hypothetical protein
MRSLFFQSDRFFSFFFKASPSQALGQSLRNSKEIPSKIEKKGIFGYHLFQPLCYDSQRLPISFL